MNNIYNNAIQQVREGAKFKVNFESKSLRINGQYVIKNGQYEGNLGIDKIESVEALSEIERLYSRYRHSIPSERDTVSNKLYFHALKESELWDEDMLFGEHRQEAQIKLELYVLCLILNGSLVWDEFAKDKWFWQSRNFPSLVILKQWIK